MSMDDVYSDLQRLLEPVSADRPAGRDVDGTLELNALEMACLEPDDPGVEGVERVDARNWREIRDQAQALLEQSKHLRAAVLLARALLQIDGLPGFCAGIDFVTSLAQRYWSELHPGLDPEDGDATMRINAIHELVSAPLLAQLRIARIASVDGLGVITVNDLLAASSAPLARADLPACEPQLVHTRLDRLGAPALHELTTLVQDSARLLQELTGFVSSRTGQYLQFGALTAAKGERTGLLDAVAELLAKQCARLDPQPSAAQADAARGASAGATRAGTGEIAHREDVLIMLDRICAYYARVEPSSPVPLLLQRAKRLASMDFLGIVRDLADQGLAQVASVAGIRVDES